MLKSYKYRLYPNSAQKAKLEMYFDGIRFIYNLALETKMYAWLSARKNISFFQLILQLKQLKDSGEVNWLLACPSQSLQASLKNLDCAYKNFFKGSGHPSFKSKKSRQSIQFPQGVRLISDSEISLPKMGITSFVQHRPIGRGNIKTVTISKTPTNKYYVSILVENEDKLPDKIKIKATTTIGIDLGIKNLAILSDGSVYQNPRFLNKTVKKLIIERRKLSRRFKKCATQSKGYEKQRIVVARLYEKITNQRRDYLHKISTSIIKKYDTVCVENLDIRQMIKSKGLSTPILDTGWGEFVRYLEYKAEWYGKNLVKIDKFDPSSKRCSNCGEINKKLKLKQRSWVCVKCKISHDRDKNAALNIKEYGLRKVPLNANVVQ